jgi:hypothetical protein
MRLPCYIIGGGDGTLYNYLFQGRHDVKEVVLSTGAASTLDTVGALAPRLLHTAAYDPLNDRMVVQGGTRDCTLRGLDPGGQVARVDCRADYDDTQSPMTVGAPPPCWPVWR